MIQETLINDLGKIIVFLLLLLSVFLTSVKSNRKLPNYLFAAFLLVTSIDLSGLFLPLSQNQTIQSFKVASVLLQMPLYFLYVRSICYFNFKLKTAHLLHAILFVIFFFVLSMSKEVETYYKTYQVITKLQYYAYIAGVVYTLLSFKKLYQENYSSNHHLIYKWLLQTTILFLIGNSFVTIRHFLSSGSLSLTYINLIISFFALFVICWFVLKALYQPQLFVGIDIDLTPTSPVTKLQVPPPEELQLLILYMRTEKPYLEDQLTLQKLAKGINLPEKQLSQLINQHIGKHFFDYINEFRIEEAKKLLTEQSELTVLEILYQIGFNSKSSFYTAFKKETGQTPIAYRKSNT
jgi:AraC-like DNA-binding protein